MRMACLQCHSRTNFNNYFSRHSRNPPAPPERKSSFSKPVLVQGGLEKAPRASDLQPSTDAAATKEVQKGPATSNTAPPAHPGKDTGELDDFKIDLTTGEVGPLKKIPKVWQ